MAAASLSGSLDEVLTHHPARHLRCLSVECPLFVTRSTEDPMEPNQPIIARLDECTPVLERLEGRMYAADDTLELLNRLPRLEHMTIYELSDSCLGSPVRFSCVTSLTLLQTCDINRVMMRLCCVLPLRRLEIEQVMQDSPSKPDRLTSQAARALLLPSSACCATLEHLQLRWIHLAPLSELFELSASLPMLSSLLVSCLASSSSPSAEAASFASFLLLKGQQMKQLDVPRQLTQPESPPVLPQLLAQCVALSRLTLTPSVAQWDLLSHAPPRPADRQTLVDEAAAASCLQDLQLESPVRSGVGVVLSLASLCQPVFGDLRQLYLRSVQLSSTSSYLLSDLPRLRHLRCLSLCALWGPAAVVGVEGVRMWSQIAPDLLRLHLEGFWKALSDVGQLTSALGAWFPRLTDLSLASFQLADERQVWDDLGRLRSLRRLTLQPGNHLRANPLSSQLLEQSIAAPGSFAQLLCLTLRLPLSNLPAKQTEWRDSCQRLRETGQVGGGAAGGLGTGYAIWLLNRLWTDL